MFATVNIHKPKGITSHDVVSRLRRIYGIKKIGHLGTLDPLAEGVLPLCLGQATRLIEYFPTDKRYTAEVTLGKVTTTLDSEGEVVSEADSSALDLSEAALKPLLERFTGVIQQQVPLYSAVHVGGKKLYELARQGKTADLPVRETTIYALNLLEVREAGSAHPVLKLDIACSSGTYIRSLARDIGDVLGVGAYMSALVRTEHGQFRLDTCVTLETLQENENPQQFLLDPVQFLTLPQVALAHEEEARLLCNGMKVQPALSQGPGLQKLKPNALYLAVWQGKPLGVVQAVSHQLKPVKIFQLDT